MADETPGRPHLGDGLLRVAEVVHAGEVSVAFKPGPTVRAKVGDKLLDIAEASEVAVESGCRMGMCGSDPVRIIEGAENLSPVRSAERRTLERLGVAGDCRMACVSRLQGPVVVDPQPLLAEPAERDGEEATPPAVVADRSLQQAIRNVVILGAGAGGVTTAEELRH